MSSLEQQVLSYNAPFVASTASLPDAAPLLKRTATDVGYVLTNIGTRSDEELLGLAKAFGPIFHQDHPVITVRDEPARGIKSMSPRALEPHTEYAYELRVPSWIVLYCLAPSVAGGEFYLIDSADLVRDLGARFEQTLRSVPFEFESRRTEAVFTRPILFPHPFRDGSALVFSTIDDLHIKNERYSASERLNNAVERLKLLLRHHAYYRLHAWTEGDVIAFDNLRYLHGRLAYTGSGRTLKHIRVA